MKLYKVLIVDDDSIVRMGLSQSTDWQAHGFVVAGEAPNGKEALSMMKQLQPDLVLTDVYMPEYDGISFIKEAKKLYPNTIFVVLSCHDNIEYVKESIKLGIYDYLLKSSIVNSDLLDKTLDKIHLTISESRELEKEPLPFSNIQYYLSAYLHGDGSIKQRLLLEMHKNGLVNSEENFFIIGIHLSDYLRQSSDDETQIYQSVLKIINEISSSQGYSYVCRHENNFLLLLHISSLTQFISAENKALSICEWIRVNVTSSLNVTCSIFLSPKITFHDLPFMFEHIHETLKAPQNEYKPDITVIKETDIAFSKQDLFTDKKVLNPLEPVFQYIYTHYQENPSLEELASMAGFSKYHLCKKFKEQTGQSVFDFLTEVRINKAKELLIQSSLKVFEISQAVGYNDAPYFNRTFKNYTGYTPKEYALRYKRQA